MIGAILNGAKTLLGIGSANNGMDRVMEAAAGVGAFIDEQKYTDEEKAKMHSEVTIPAMQAFLNSTVGESTLRSQTRRDLAIWIIRNWFLMLWVSIIAFGIELIVASQVENAVASDQHVFSAFVLGVATIAQLLYLVLGVGAFFFGAHINRDMPWARDK